MGATWTLFSPLLPPEMRALEEACEATAHAWLEGHPDCDDTWGEILAGGVMPTPAEVLAAYQRYRLPLTGPLLDRYRACRSALTIDRPGDLDADRLQVSVLRFLVQRAGDALLLFNDYPLIPAEEVLRDLAGKPGVPDFEAAPAPRQGRPVRRRPERAGELRAVRLVELLRAAQGNPELSIDVIQVLRATPDLGRRYAALLMENGAMSDARAASALEVPARELAAAADALDAALRKVAP